jgi:hypothetical protein
LPAPELFQGIREVIEHNARGHFSYLLGQVSQNGFWNFYFVVLAVKTPIAFLALLLAGAAFVVRSSKTGFARCLPVAFSLGVLLVALFSRINIGVRHILPIYMSFSLLAAVAVLRLLETSGVRAWIPAAVAILLGWFAVNSLLSHPDYLPYFNEFAGSHPENILVDSDLDWGQDFKRLLGRLRQGGAKVLTLSSRYYIKLDQPGFPVIRPLNPNTPLTGWNAVSMTAWKLLPLDPIKSDPYAKLWPDLIPPQEIVGKSIYLWYFPPSAGYPLN